MKKRLDELVCSLKPELSKSKAQSVIMSGMVYVEGQKETKSGSMFPEDAEIEIRGETLKYVSRGGLKLEKAIDVFEVDPKNKVCMDIGSSTGGFTDCMLQNGASKVYAVDVGKGQLDWKLRNDDRVVVMEKTNIRYVEPEDIPEKPELISIDVSFISLGLVVPVAVSLLKEKGEIVMLIKPQFEAGREKVGKKGVVKDPETHVEVIEKVFSIVDRAGLSIRGLDFSPVKGPEGNIEYLLYATKGDKEDINTEGMIEQVVKKAHGELDK